MPEAKTSLSIRDLDIRISVTREARLPAHPVRLVVSTHGGADMGYASVRVVDTIIPSENGARDDGLDALINVITSGIVLAITSGAPRKRCAPDQHYSERAPGDRPEQPASVP